MRNHSFFLFFVLALSIDSVEIFDKEGNYRGEYEYSEMKGNHRKVIDAVKK